MERQHTSSLRTGLATLMAPIAWGTTYVTITQLLPEGRPLFISAMRVIPAGILLLVGGSLASPWRPRGTEWWQTATLSVFNFGLFFPLLIIGVHRLPGGVAAAVGGLQPLLVAAVTWLIGGKRPKGRDLSIGLAAALGVALIVIRPGADVDTLGVFAAIGANVSFSIGVVLTKRFASPTSRLSATGWQMLMSGVILVPVAALAEGAPPALSVQHLAGFAYLSLAATGVAFVLWFNGIRRLPVAAPPLLGLAAPITGAVLGWTILDESLSLVQLVGFAVTIAAISYGASLRATQSERRTARLQSDGTVAPCAGTA